MAASICKPPCDDGKICRKGFTRKNGVKVKAHCVIDTGIKGKTPEKKKIKLKRPLVKGTLHDLAGVPREQKLTYSRKECNAIGDNAAHRQMQWRTPSSKMVLIRNYNKNKNPELADKIEKCRQIAKKAFDKAFL